MAEKYDLKQNKWEEYEIKGAFPLAAFGWTALAPESGQILILGGTDGDLIQEDAWIVDFKNQKAERQDNSVESPLASSKLIFRSKANKIYCIGGFGSGGQNYQKKNEPDAQWEEFERSHASLMSTGSGTLELAHFSSIYFD